ncbi:MAG: endonuclease/exonuclease/phosphatase family protein [Rikenellaceae bacterium]
MGKKATFILVKLIFRVATIIAAIFGGIGFFAKYITPQESWVITLIGIGLLPVLIVNFIILIYWLIKRNSLAIAPLIAILLNICFITSMFQVDFRKPTKTHIDLKVATYNIHGFAQQDFYFIMRGISNFMKEEKVDVVCFQEFYENDRYTLDSLCRIFSDMPYFSAPAQTNGAELAIFSKYPIAEHSLVRFANTENSSMWADIVTHNDTVRIFNNHFQTTNINQSKREIANFKTNVTNEVGKESFDIIMSRLYVNSCMRVSQVATIKNIIDTTRHEVIVCGDFNDTPASYAYRQIAQILSDGFKSCGKGYAATFNPFYKILRLDYIFYSKGIEGIRYYSPSKNFSDHNPVLLEFAFRD